MKGAPGPLRAEALAAGLPPLLVEAERVAATVAQGLHGRRRVGTGESFWQFRPYVAGDAPGRIDWRRSARGGQLHVRETEWDAAQTVTLWRDGGEGMRWRSETSLPDKADRAELLLLALASLLLRGGERVRVADDAQGASGAAALQRLAAKLAYAPPGLPVGWPPAHGRMVLLGDFLGDIGGLRGLLAGCAALSVRGELLQILDPAEVELPYSGRVRFVGVGDDRVALVPKVEAIRDAYRDQLAARQAELRRLCAGGGFGFSVHQTDAAPHGALLALYLGLGRQ